MIALLAQVAALFHLKQLEHRKYIRSIYFIYTYKTKYYKINIHTIGSGIFCKSYNTLDQFNLMHHLLYLVILEYRCS